MADTLSSESHSIPRILPVPVLWGNCVYHPLYSWLPGLPANGTVRGAPSHQKVMAAAGRALLQVTLSLSTLGLILIFHVSCHGSVSSHCALGNASTKVTCTGHNYFMIPKLLGCLFPCHVFLLLSGVAGRRGGSSMTASTGLHCPCALGQVACAAGWQVRMPANQ